MANVSKIALPNGAEYGFRDGTVFIGTSTQWTGETDKTKYTLVYQTDIPSVSTCNAGVLTELFRGAIFVGASASSAGAYGLVPAPTAGQENYVLYGNGTWGALSTDVTANDTTENVIFGANAVADDSTENVTIS